MHSLMPSFPINQSVDCHSSDVSSWLKAGHHNMVETKHATVLDPVVRPMCFSDLTVSCLSPSVFLGKLWILRKKKVGFAFDACSCFNLSLTWSTLCRLAAVAALHARWVLTRWNAECKVEHGSVLEHFESRACSGSVHHSYLYKLTKT